MCGRYFIAEEGYPQEMWEIIDILQQTYGGERVKTGEIRPTDEAPVIANSRTLTPRPFLMRWGYPMASGRLVINTRSETAAEKPIFADSIKNRRCLVPASHYFEWEKRGRERIRYAIAPEKSRFFLMAGLYRLSNGRAEYTILTRDPAPEISAIHNRMPLIIPTIYRDAWLDPRVEAQSLMKEIGHVPMRFGVDC